MTYRRASFRFVLLTALLGGATQARAEENVPQDEEQAGEPAATDAKEAGEPVAVEKKEVPAPVKAEPQPMKEPTPEERQKAKERTARALHLFRNAAYKGALTELEAAYTLAPSRSLLYHIASVYAAMGNPVEAIDNLDDLLEDQGPLKPKVLEQARALKEEQQQQVGQLEVQVNVPATIAIDGTRIGQTPFDRPIRLKSGQHIISVVAEGYLPQRQTVSVAGSGQSQAVFELQPMEGKLAYVKVYSAVPAVQVIADDVPVGKTPIDEAVAVVPGKHVFELQRPGYMNHRRELDLSDGAHATVAFDAEEDPSAPEETGQLVLVDAGSDVRVTVDGRALGKYRAPITLPAGPHILRLERKDYEPLERTVDVPRGSEREVEVALRSKGVKEAAIEATARTYRNWAIASLASGVAVLAGGTALAVWSNSNLPAAEDNLAKVKSESEQQGCNDPQIDDRRRKLCEQQLSAAQSDVDKYTNFRLYGIGGAALGAALVGVGVWLLVAAPDVPDTGGEGSLASTITPVLSAGPDGASLLLRGRF
jgi:hypothetical protein